MSRIARLSFCVALSLGACGGDGGGDDGGADASVAPDAAGADASRVDAGSAAPGHALSPDPFGFHSGSAEGYAYLEELGAIWTRDETYVVWDWVDPGRDGHLSFRSAAPPPIGGGSPPPIDYDALRAQRPAWVRSLVNVCPFRMSESFASEAQRETYAAFVERMVERYDGDADLGCTEAAPDCYHPGDGEHPTAETIAALEANPVHDWQVCNQVTDTCAGPDCMDTYATRFAEVQRRTYDAVHAADPGARVLIAGDSAPDLYPRVFDALGGDGVDVVDFHYFGQEHEYFDEERFGDLQASLTHAGFDLADVRIWVTETGTYSGDPVDDRDGTEGPPLQTERQQAAGLVKRYVALLGAGVERVFWAWNLVEGFGPCACCIFDYTGIVYDGNVPANEGGCDAADDWDRGRGVKKLAFFSAQRLFGALADATRVTRQSGPGDARVYRFERDGGALWVAWTDAAGSEPLTIDGLDGDAARVTSAVPSTDFGEDVVDASTAFDTEERPVVDGALTIELGSEPVYVEAP